LWLSSGEAISPGLDRRQRTVAERSEKSTLFFQIGRPIATRDGQKHRLRLTDGGGYAIEPERIRTLDTAELRRPAIMSAIDHAQARLDAALDRLERALEHKRSSAGLPADAALAGEVTGLREECHQLRERLAAAEAQHQRLKGTMAAMGTRLDAAIGELDALIETKAAE
jgi:glutathione S-transferase